MKWQKSPFRRLMAAAVSFCMLLSLSACAKAPAETTAPPEPDVQAVQQTMEQYDQIITDAEPILAQYQDEDGYVAPEDQDAALQQISEYAKELHEHGKITDYSYEPGDTGVYMRIDDRLTVLYDVPVQDRMAGGLSSPEIVTLEPNATEFTGSYLLSGMGGPVEAATMVTAAFPEVAYNCKARNEEVTVESFKRELHNSIMIFCGHGNYNSRLGPVLFTGIEAYDPATILLYTLEFGDEAIVLNQKGQFYLTHVFFDKYVPEDAYAGSLIYLGSCSSAQDERLVQSMFNRGARAVIGNNQSIQVAYNYRMICSFFAGLSHQTLEGSHRTFLEALEYAKELEGEACPITGTRVIGYHLEGDDFTLPELIDPVDHRLDVHGTLSIYDKNGDYYSGYTLTIESIALRLPTADRQPNVDTQYSQTIEVNTAGPYPLELPAGLYRFEISDAHNPDTYSFIVEAAPGFSSNLDLITTYEKPLVVVIPEVDYENLVTDAYTDTFVDEYGLVYCYHIPKFLLSGDRAESLNNKIYTQCYEILARDVYPCIQEFGYSETMQMVYAWGHHNDYASVLIANNFDWGGVDYYVYSISTSTGQEAGMDELLAAFGLNREAFYELVHDRLKQYWDELYAFRDNIGDDAFFEDRMTRTLSTENIHKVIPYINPDGGLSFVAEIYSMAGADSYLHLINAEGAFEADYLECTQVHTTGGELPTDDPLQFFIENCDRRFFTVEEIQDFDDTMCMYARNAIFAKSGRKFQSPELQSYFAQYAWYHPHIEPEDFQDSILSTIQRANLDLIQTHERKLESDAQPSVSAQTTAQALDAYGSVLDMFYSGISCGWSNCDGHGWGEIDDPDDACYIFPQYLSDHSLKEIGFALKDLNRDGTLELMIAPMDLKDNGEFYDLYTISNGKIIHTASAGERDRLYLANDGSINNRSSGSAASNAVSNKHLDPSDGKLKVNQAVVYDEYIDRERPWFYATEDYYNSKTYDYDYDSLKSISEHEAAQIQASFPAAAALELTAFDRYGR